MEYIESTLQFLRGLGTSLEEYVIDHSDIIDIM